MYCVCVCIVLQYLLTCSYTQIHRQIHGTANNPRAKLNSRFIEPERKQNVHLQHTQPRQAKYCIGNSSKSLVSTMQNISQVPTTIYDRNFGHYVPAALLHRTQNSPTQFQKKPNVDQFF